MLTRPPVLPGGEAAGPAAGARPMSARRADGTLSADEKRAELELLFAPMLDAIDKFCGPGAHARMARCGLISLVPFTEMRGMTFAGGLPPPW